MISQDALMQLERACGGQLNFVFHNLQTGTIMSQRPQHKVKTASVIKLPLLVHVALSVHEGVLRWNTLLTLTDQVKSAGTGILNGMTAGVQLPLHDVCYLMTVLSDNTATDMLIDYIGIEPVNQRMQQLGFAQTILFKKAYVPDTSASVPYGMGVTTAHEMAALLAQIANATLGNVKATDEIYAMLLAQQDRTAIPRYLPAGWQYAGKSGSMPDVRNDVGIVTAPDGRRFVLALFCQQLQVQWTVDDAGLVALARLAHQLLVPTS